MNKILKNIVMILGLFLISLVGNVVNAETYNGRLYELYHPNSGFTVFAEEDSRNMDYNSWMIKSTIDNKIYYCIDPAIPLEGALEGSHNYIIGKNNIIVSSKITKAKYDKIEALAFYGYSYKDDTIDHTDKKWYGITQVMIWRVMRPDLNWTFKETRNSKPNKTLYSKEVKELEKLANNFKTISSFSDKNYKVLLEKEIKIEDTNKVLPNFFIVNSLNKIELQKEGNILKIKGKKQGVQTIHLSRKIHTSSRYALLKSDNFQDIIVMGNGDLPFFNFKVTVTGGTLNLIKNDNDTKQNNASGEATLKDAGYKIYDLNDNLIDTIKTDENGLAKIILDYGKYKIKESKAPKGYKLNDNYYSFTIDENNTDIKLNVYDEVIKGKLVINKTKGGAGEGYKPEEDAVFEVYDIKQNLITTITTNKEGKAETNLPYGTYKIKQIKGKNGYVFSEDKEISIKSEKTYEINIKNKRQSKLEIIKLDKNNKKPIKDTVLEIYNSSDKKLLEGKTDKNGKLIVYNIPIGDYYIKEKSSSKYYKKTNEKYSFSIKENGKIVKISIFNEKVRGTLEFYKIDSLTGKKLANATINLINKENNKTLYKKVTDKNGIVKIKNLEGGSYCIKEIEAPSGYKKDEKPLCFELEKENEVIKLSMTNEKLVKIPNTYKKALNIAFVVGMICVISSFSFFVYEKRK